MTGTTIAVLEAFLEASGAALYGLEIMKAARIKSGTLYPILDRLETAGWIAGRWEQVDDDVNRPRRRYYELTGVGAQESRRELTRRQAKRPQARPAW